MMMKNNTVTRVRLLFASITAATVFS